VTTQSEEDSLIGEIIDKASGLPFECLDLILEVAKGMAFTKSCMAKQTILEVNTHKTA